MSLTTNRAGTDSERFNRRRHDLKDQDQRTAVTTEGRFWWQRLMFILLTGLSGYLVGQYDPIIEQYSATATLQIDPRELFDSDELGESQNDRSTRLKTFVDSIATTHFMRNVILKNGLVDQESFAGPNAGIHSVDRLARGLSRRVEASLREGTYLLDIRLEYSDRDMALDLVNWVSEELVANSAERGERRSQHVLEVVKKQAEASKRDLKQADSALIEFRKRSNLVVPAEQRRSLLTARLEESHADLARLIRMNAKLSSDLELIKSFGDVPTLDQLLSVPSIYLLEEVVIARQGLKEYELEKVFQGDELKGTLESYQRLATHLNRVVRDAPFELETEWSRLKHQERSLQSIIQSWELEFLNFSSKVNECRVLERLAEDALEMHLSLLRKIRNIESGMGLTSEGVWIVEKATWSSNISASSWTYGFPRIIYGLLCGFAVILLYDYRLVSRLS